MSSIHGETDPDREPPIVIDPIPERKPTDQDHGHENSGGAFIKFLAIVVIILFVVVVAYKLCVKKLMKKRRLQRMSEQGYGADVSYQEFASYSS